MSGNRTYEHHGENPLEAAANDLMGVSSSNRGYVVGTDNETGETATGPNKADVDRQLDKK